MASEERKADGFTSLEDRYSDYVVYDNEYERIGKVDDLFVGEDDGLEYLGVKMGFLGTKSTLIPFQIVRINDERKVLEVATDKERVKGGPAFGEDREITPDFEREVYAYYGLDQSSGERGGYGNYHSDYPDRDGDADLAPKEREDSSGAAAAGAPRHTGGEDRDIYARSEDSRAAGRDDSEAGNVGPGMTEGDIESGYLKAHSEDDEGVMQSGSDLEDEDELRVSRSEEELRAGTREREAGAMKVRKRVHTERERLEVPTRREEVSVERVPVDEAASEADIGADEVIVPVVEEEVIVSKRAVKKEEIRLKKDVVEDTQVVEEDVRKEEVEVEDGTGRGHGPNDGDPASDRDSGRGSYRDGGFGV